MNLVGRGQILDILAGGADVNGLSLVKGVQKIEESRWMLQFSA